MPNSRVISSWAIWLVLSVPLLPAQQASRVPPRITGKIDDARLATLRGNTHPLARAEYDLGAAPRDLPMERILLLLGRSPEQEAALQQLLEEQQDPGSGQFHKWLTPQQFGERFGPAPEDIDKVTGWLTSHGFRVDRVANGRGTIEFSGTAAQVERALHTAIHGYLVHGERHWANSSDPRIPVALTPVVAGIVSLHDFPIKATRHNMGTFRKRPGDGKWVPEYTVTLRGETVYIVAPYDFATIYNVLPAWSAGIDGTGQTIAIVGRSNIALSDVRNFRSLFGLPSNDPTITLDGADPGTSNVDDEAENVADVEWAGAVAKGATIDLVVSQSTVATDGVNLSSQYIVDNDVAPVMSSSYGTCEVLLLGQTTYTGDLWQQAAAEGITVVVGSGDGGPADCDQGAEGALVGLQVNGAASTPYNIAVGGTDFDDVLQRTDSAYWSSTNNPATLASARSYIPETPWNDSCADSALATYFGYTNGETFCNSVRGQPFLAVIGGGGGASGTYAKPSWQAGVNGIPADGQRDLPDVSFFAGDGLKGQFYPTCQADNGGTCDPSSAGGPVTAGGGGTSFGAPAFAGVMALINQKTGSRQGLANPRLYQLAATQYGSSTSPATSKACDASYTIAAGNACVFFDVTTGTIDVPCMTTSVNCYAANSADTLGLVSTSNATLVPAYSAATGYDLASGLGSVNVANLVKQWATDAQPAPALSVSKTHTGNFAPGQTGAVYTVRVSNGAMAGPTTATVTVQEIVPTGLTLVSMAGTGWTCGGTTCTRSDALVASASYPAITVTVNVASNAAAEVTNQVAVLGGGSALATAGDITNIAAAKIATTATVAASPSTIAASASTTLTVTVAGASGSVTPTGTVVFALGGTLLGSATLTGRGGSAQATLTVTGSQLTVGGNSITATYGGNTNYSGSTAVAIVTVTAGPSISFAGVLNSASNLGGPVSPGEIVSIYGSSIGPANPSFLTLDATGKVSTSIGGVTVSFDGVLAPLTYVGQTQINAIVPYEIAGDSAPTLQVTYSGQASNQIALQLVTVVPAIFTYNGSGSGPGAILNADSSVNTQSNPAPVGSVIQVFMTGEGLTTPAQATGAVTPVNTSGTGALTPAPQEAVTVTIGGKQAGLKFAGEAPYLVAGVLQVNATIPASATSGANSLVVQVGGQPSQSGVTVWVR